MPPEQHLSLARVVVGELILRTRYSLLLTVAQSTQQTSLAQESTHRQLRTVLSPHLGKEVAVAVLPLLEMQTLEEMVDSMEAGVEEEAHPLKLLETLVLAELVVKESSS
jgi:hypothetical protein